jgi:hypothetical protein
MTSPKQEFVQQKPAGRQMPAFMPGEETPHLNGAGGCFEGFAV